MHPIACHSAGLLRHLLLTSCRSTQKPAQNIHQPVLQDVLKRVQFGMKAAQILGGAAVATCAALLTLGRPLPVAPLALWAVAVGVCAAGWRGLRALEKRLTFADYVHAER